MIPKITSEDVKYVAEEGEKRTVQGRDWDTVIH